VHKCLSWALGGVGGGGHGLASGGGFGVYKIMKTYEN
jgi:hypothetical protein